MNKLNFSELNLSPEIHKAIQEMGFEEATQIQSEAIPVMLSGVDLIGQAQTGTGKTAAFGIPILEMINHKERKVQAVIMCPTRELAMQVAEEITKLGKHMRGLQTLAIYGGQPINRQIKALQHGVHIIVCTPGRLMDHLERRTVNLDSVKIAILDEADEMLNMGFVDDMEKILKQMPATRQTALFSATMPRPILELTKKYQKNPKLVKVVHETLTAPNIEQIYFEVKRSNKLDALTRVLDKYDFKASLVFCNTKRGVDELVEQLKARGYMAEAIHGDKIQTQRDRVMARFRSGAADILVATDVAARGIDVSNVEAVFNYDVPQDEEYYVHRIGRTGRAGKSGKAFTFATSGETFKLRDIQRYAKTRIVLQKLPTLEDIQGIRENQFFEKVKEAVDAGGNEKYVTMLEKLMNDLDMSSTEIGAALLKMLSANEQKEASTPAQTETKTSAGILDRDPSSEWVKLFLNIGKKDNARVGDLVGAIAGETGLDGKIIGKIDMRDNFSFVEVPSNFADDVVNIMNQGKTIKGKRINMEIAKGRDGVSEKPWKDRR
ncbi:MAG: DEAD/DEAH box helicase [bacterium]